MTLKARFVRWLLKDNQPALPQLGEPAVEMGVPVPTMTIRHEDGREILCNATWGRMRRVCALDGHYYVATGEQEGRLIFREEIF